MSKIYNSSDIFVLPSLSEGMPNALVEAMSSSLPCITTNLKNINSQIIDHGLNGYLFKINNKKKLEKYLIKLIKSKKLRKKIGDEARKTINKNFSIIHNINSYEKMYYSLID